MNRKNMRKGVFLVVVDSTDEFMIAVDYACAFANAEGGYVALLNIMERAHVESWANIENRVRKDMRSQAEQMVWNAAGRVIEATENIPMVCIEEGDSVDVILNTIESNPNIVALVLASDPNASNPGPLISYFSGKGISRMSVPLMIVPGHLETPLNT